MHVDLAGFGYMGQRVEQARHSLWRRIMTRLAFMGPSYPLDPHLARDIGAESYKVLLFPIADAGEGR